MFSNKDLRKLIIPLVIEQLLAVTIGMADTVMVSSCGEAAVSGISLVDSINFLLITLFSSLATGGAVIASQYIGRGDHKSASLAAKQLFYASLALSAVLGVIAVFFRRPVLISILMNTINIVGNAILIYGFQMAAAGAAAASLVSRAVGAIIITVLLLNPRRIIFYDKLHKPEIHLSMLKSILQIGVPNGLENSIFQIGKILVASIVSGFGTISITANAVAGNLASLQVIPGMALGMAMITVVGQCIGAKDYEAVKKYTKKLMLITYGVVWAMTLLMLLFSKQILSFYSLSAETTTMTMEVFIVHGICAVIVWPLAFALPNALRAANDVRFTMIVSLLSMWIFRIGFSYILAIYFNMGILGTWIAMCIDWFCRGACFVIRFARGKWKNISFIDN